MKRLNLIWIIVVCLGFSFSVVFAQNKMWVTSGQAKLKTDKNASSKTIATLPMGTEVTVLASEKKWYRVRAASGEEGWMYQGLLSKSPPEQKAQNETENLFSALPGSGIKADKADTSRSIRGLSSETEEYAKNRRTPETYKKALDQVLALSVSEHEVEDFLSKGKIGEYAP